MKLQELEQKYEELGREIEKLKNQKKGKRWKPDCGEEYYFIGLFGGVCEFSWNNCPQDNYLYSQGNCFQTEEEAKEQSENLKTKAELRALAEELNGDEVIDWNDGEQWKYCIFYTSRIASDERCTCQSQGAIYCLDPDFLDKAIKRIGEERLIKMIKSGVQDGLSIYLPDTTVYYNGGIDRALLNGFSPSRGYICYESS